MDFLTQTTIISPLTRVRQERLLPDRGEVLAKIGQEMSPVQVVARSPLKMDYHVVPVCSLLKISPESLAELLLVSRGDVVEQGMPLIKKRGIGRKAFNSPVDGTLFDVVNGRLVFQQVSEVVALRALAKSRVVNRITDRGVVLEISGSRIQGVWDSGKEGFGTLHVVTETAVDPFTSEHFATEGSNQVLVVGKTTEADLLEQAQHANINGLITGSIAAELIPLAKSVNFPIFVTDGFGEQGMAEMTFQLMQKSEARDVALFNRPRDQDGRRPEIIIPLEAVSGDDFPTAGQSLTTGQTVRILRAPHRNQIGTIVRLYQQTRLTSIGSRAYGADIKLSDGQINFVPIANLDVII